MKLLLDVIDYKKNNNNNNKKQVYGKILADSEGDERR